MVRRLHAALSMQHLRRVISLSWLFAAACLSGVTPDGGGGGGGRGPDAGVTPVGPTADDLTREWSGCMTLDHFQLANMTAWGSLVAGTGQDCASCHGTGFEGFFADRDATAMFNAITTTKQFLLNYFSPDVANHKMIVNQTIFQAVASGQPPFQGHPTFNPTNNAGMTALRSFYDVTSLQQQSHTCDPPRLQ